jgi:hypothetical protein
MNKAIRILRRIFLVIFLPIFFIITMLIISIPVFSLVEWSCKREVKGEIPGGFPILVITPSKESNECEGQIIYKKHLNDFLANNREYTFFVPEGQAERLNKEILKKCAVGTGNFNSGSQNPWLERFKVTPIANGRQLLEVESELDDDYKNVGWYETDGKEIFPKFHKWFLGPGLAMGALYYAFFLNIVVWAAGLIVFVIYKKRRRTAKSTN